MIWYTSVILYICIYTTISVIIPQRRLVLFGNLIRFGDLCDNIDSTQLLSKGSFSTTLIGTQ